jgi:hypothetical protein
MTKPRIIRGGDESESDLSEMFAALSGSRALGATFMHDTARVSG